MRSGTFLVLTLAGLSALWPGCLCVAQFPEALVNDDQGASDRIGSDRPGGDVVGLEGRATEARLHELPRTEARLHDLPRTEGPRPDLPRIEGPKPDIAPARADLKITSTVSPPCAPTALCPGSSNCTVNAGLACTGLVDCGSATVCTVNCTGNGACAGGVSCNKAQQCFITCKDGACGNINCASGTYCKVDCSLGSCKQDVNCGGCACKASCDETSCGAPLWDKLFCNCKQVNSCDCIKFPCANP